MAKPRRTATRRSFVKLITALTAILVAGFVALTTSDSASANHQPRGGKSSVVADRFDLEGGRTVPPHKITCVWRDKDESYNCEGKNFSQLLTTKSQEDSSDYLPRGLDFIKGDVGNPHKFSCERPKDISTVKPSDYSCSYARQKFQMDQMVYISAPKNCNSSSPECIEFVLPPRK
jgi:hypothetical protein